MTNAQKTLSAEQTKEFYHDLFVSEQVVAFTQTAGRSLAEHDLVVEIGGGCGYFAAELTRHLGIATVVVDTDRESIAACRNSGIDARQSDALNPRIEGDETIACFNMVLHHLIGAGSKRIRHLQSSALAVWRAQVRLIFVNEYVYESYIRDGFSSWLIWTITSSRLLSVCARWVSRLAPSLRANTLGVGVRFQYC